MALRTHTNGNNDSSNVFLGKMDDIRNLYQLLKAVNFEDTAVFRVSEHGIKVTVEVARSVQSNAFIKADLFQEFTRREDKINFTINLTVLLECLNIFGSASGTTGSMTTLKMCYAGYGNPLVLLLQENEVITDCSIKTLDADEVLDFDFNAANIVGKIILKSDNLKEIFNELDLSSDVLEILMSPDKPYFRLSTFGHIGTIHVDYPKNSDVIEVFDCNETKSEKYKMSLIKQSVKALLISQKISIRMDENGFLCLQYMIESDGHTCFVDFYCAPQVEGED